MMNIGKHDALLVVDVQNDFLPGGALSMAGGDRIVPVINRISALFTTRVFTRDWHPADHVSFSGHPQFLDQSWPPHCIQNTWGAQFHADLKIDAKDRIVSTGDNPQEENYSSFHGTDLEAWLRRRDIRRIFIAGLFLREVRPGPCKSFAIQASISFHPAICCRNNGNRLKFLTGGV